MRDFSIWICLNCTTCNLLCLHEGNPKPCSVLEGLVLVAQALRQWLGDTQRETLQASQFMAWWQLPGDRSLLCGLHERQETRRGVWLLLCVSRTLSELSQVYVDLPCPVVGATLCFPLFPVWRQRKRSPCPPECGSFSAMISGSLCLLEESRFRSLFLRRTPYVRFVPMFCQVLSHSVPTTAHSSSFPSF